MILHVEKRWKEAFLVLPNGETIFLKQERGCVCQITAYQCAVHPGNSHPSLSIFGGKTVKKRVNEILTEHGERLTVIPIGMDPLFGNGREILKLHVSGRPLTAIREAARAEQNAAENPWRKVRDLRSKRPARKDVHLSELFDRSAALQKP